MTVTEKVAYIKGLVDGLDLDAKKDEVKVIKAIVELLDDIAMSVSDLEEGLDVVSDQVDEIDEDLSDLESYVYEEDDYGCGCEDDDYYEIDCPKCGETICVDDGILEEGSIECPNCGELLEFDFDDCCCDDDCDCDHD
ncbi:MAG: CD1247 N-terminal domain-containing protein [Acutalibacteraceae bacterium]